MRPNESQQYKGHNASKCTLKLITRALWWILFSFLFYCSEEIRRSASLIYSQWSWLKEELDDQLPVNAHTSTSNCSVTLKIIVQRQNIQWISQGNFLGRPQSKWLTKKAVLWAILGVYSHSVVVKWQSGHVIKKIYAVHIFLMIWILALQIFIQSFYTPNRHFFWKALMAEGLLRRSHNKLALPGLAPCHLCTMLTNLLTSTL